MEATLNYNIHEKLNGWLNKLDHFQLQFSLGKMETKDEYAKQKNLLHYSLHRYIQTAENFENVAEEKVTTIKKSLIDFKNEFHKDEEATEKSIIEHKNSVVKLIEKVFPSY